MRGPGTVLCLLQVACVLGHDGLTLVLSRSRGQRNSVEEPARSAMPTKRAFDRVDMSPFDFGSFSKRYNEPPALGPFRRKKSFDRLDQGPFGLAKRKRAFDRVDNGFGFGKRSDRMTIPVRAAWIEEPRPVRRMSLEEFVRQADLLEPLV